MLGGNRRLQPVVDGGSQATPGEDPPASIPTWEEIARTYGRFLFTVSFRLTGNRDEAQDLVQEVLVRVQRGLATYRPGSMEGWLSRIATNAFLDDVRKKKRRPADPVGEDLDRLAVTTASADEASAADKLPDYIQDALRRLPDDYRVAVVLCDVVGLSYAEIADNLGVPVGTVRSRIHRGRSMLRGVLA